MDTRARFSSEQGIIFLLAESVGMKCQCHEDMISLSKRRSDSKTVVPNIMTDLNSVLNSVELVDASMADGKCPLSDPFVQLVVSRELPRFDVEWQPLQCVLVGLRNF